MKTKVAILVCSVFSTLVLSASAITIGSNITIYDGASGRSSPGSVGGVGPGLEDQQTDYWSGWGQAWDFEGFFWDDSTKKLTGVGGFDFVNSYHDQLAGDVFIAVNGNAQIPAGLPTDGLNGYDYVLDFEWNDGVAGTGYRIINLSGAILEPCQSGRPGSNPYRYVSGGEVVASGLFADYVTGLNDDLDGNGVVDVLGGDGSHNAFTVDMSWLNQGFTVHQTMTCGNDGHNAHVPDGGLTVCLLGIAMAGLGIVYRRVRG